MTNGKRTKTAFRTNRRTRTAFPVSRTRTAFVRQPTFVSKEPPAIEPIVSRLGTRLHPTQIIPFDAELRLRDGRKLNVRVQALNEKEAISQIQSKFPLAVIAKIHKKRTSTLRRIGRRITETAEKIGRTAERLESAIEGDGLHHDTRDEDSFDGDSGLL